jgi:F-type H+-transporting ATPase subunit a
VFAKIAINYLKSPIEQFEIVPLFNLEIYERIIDLTITNLLLTSFTILVFITSLTYFIAPKSNQINENTIFFIPNRWQLIIEYLIKAISQIVTDNLGNGLEAQKFLPFILSLFSLILFTNLIGLLPYSFTITSHLIITFLLSFSIFIGTNIICFQKHNFRMIELFVPANTSFLLTLLLIPIEFISYISKPISLGVRLFINLMAGHCLLKVIVGFSWVMLLLENILPILHILPLIVLVLLIGLELGVAVIQAYVFTVLTCIYLSDSINLH